MKTKIVLFCIVFAFILFSGCVNQKIETEAGTLYIGDSEYIAEEENKPQSINSEEKANSLCAPYTKNICSTANMLGTGLYICNWEFGTEKCVAKKCSSYTNTECPDVYCEIKNNVCSYYEYYLEYSFGNIDKCPEDCIIKRNECRKK